MKKKILIVTQDRSDAIGVCDQEILSRLDGFDAYELKKKGTSRIVILGHYMLNIFSILWKVQKYDIIYFSWQNPYLLFVKWLYPKKYVVCTAHHVESYRGDTWIGKQIFKKTDKFIAISEFTKSQLVRYGVTINDIVVNYNGIKTAYYPERINNFKPYQYVLYVGTEVSRKNTSTLLQAFAKLIEYYPNLKLIKIGKPGPGSAQVEFDKNVQKLKLQNNIILKREFVEDDLLRKYYSNAVCTISVAVLEGFGLTIPEAMACGSPVVVSDIPPFREIVGDAGQVVNSYDVSGIKKAISRYIEDEDLRQHNIASGLLRIDLFDRDNNVVFLSSFLSSH